MHASPLIAQRSKGYEKRPGQFTDMTIRNSTGHNGLILTQTTPMFWAQRWILREFPSRKVTLTKLYQKAGMDLPIATGLVHRTLKTLMKRQIVANCVLPAHSILCELREVALDEAVDLSQGAPFERRAENCVGDEFYIGEWRRISLSFWLRFLRLLHIIPLLLSWHRKMEIHLIQLLCPFHSFLPLEACE